ncbi:MAG: SDR family oxidoreductase, partial [Spirochaetaceae bacterium]|nr:SDR family oxidoreductase [Spirochaetaceae bacterium]
MNSMKELAGRTCIVTGAARSIGLAIAEAFVDAGAKVAMIDINPDVVKEAERMAGSGSPVKGYVLDITNREAVLDCFAGIAKELGEAYTLVNTAGIVDQRPIEDTTPEIMDRVMRVNVHGTLYCIQGVIGGMKKAKDGKIINFSSKSGKTGSALMAPYSAAKGAVIALTQAVAFELADFNIKVNALCPGIT